MWGCGDVRVWGVRVWGCEGLGCGGVSMHDENI